MNMNQDEKSMSLKEASKISGYAPDYIGQLIRNGKLSGKQIYSGVAWVTTERAVLEYMREKDSERKSSSSWSTVREPLRRLSLQVRYEMQFAKVFKTVLYIAVMLSVGLSLVLFYIFSTSLEHRLNQQAIEKLEAEK